MRSFSASKRLFIILSILTAVTTVFSFQGSRFNFGANAEAVRQSFVAATLSATKTGALDTSAGGDANGNGGVNPGDRLKYQIVINNSGTDASGVNFSDSLDPNTTYVSGSIIVSPVAVNETYSAIGNVNISVPAANGLLANDLNPNGSGTLTITSAPTVSTNGGNVSVNTADGSFTYNPPVGFEGADTFTYTLSNGTGLTDTATVTINVTGMIWFINNNAGACSSNCNGRLSNPFTTLAAFNTANALSGGLNPDSNDNIFIYESATQYTGAVSLRTGQKLIGQDATATLAAITNLTLPTFSASFPAMNSGNGLITNIGSTVTLNTNATLRGFSINSTTAAGINDAVSSITGVNTSEVNVATTTGTAIILSDAGGTLSFTKVSANGAANGISLTNTTGSFTVTGSSSGNCGGDANPSGTATSPDANDCTGGTIQNTVGTDLASSGIGVYLSNVQNISLTRVKLNNHQNFAVRGINVSGFLLNNVYITGTNGTSVDNGAGTATNEGSVSFDNLTGSASVTESYIEGGYTDNFRVINTSGSLNRITFTGSTFGLNGFIGNTAILLNGYSTANVNATVQNCRFQGSRATTVAYALNENSSGDVIITGNNLKNTHSNKVTGSTGLTVASVSSGAMSYNISGNSVNDALGSGIEADRLAGGSGTLTGSITNNTVGTSGIANSGSRDGSGIFVGLVGNGTAATYNATVTGNTIRQFTNYGIRVANRGTGAGYLNASVKNNNIAEPSPLAASTLFPTSGIRFELGATSGPPPDNGKSCLDISGNTLNNAGTNGGAEIRIFGRFSTVTALPGLSGSANTFLAAQNTITTSGTPVNATSTNPFQSTCPPSSVAMNNAAPILPESGALNNSLALNSQFIENLFKARQSKISIETNLATDIDNTGQNQKNVSLFNNFSSLLSKISNQLIPTAQAETNPIAIAVLSGETITKSLGALPAGESITVQFKATVNAAPANFFSVSNTANITAAGGISINSTTATNAVVQPASIAKSFGAAFAATGGATSLTYTITNANSVALSGLSFSDTLPAGLIINTPNGANNTCGGTPTATQGASVVSLSGGTVNPNTTCTVKVDVKGTSEGAKTGSTNTVNSTNGGAGNSASSALNVINAPSFTKSFGSSTVQLNGSTSLSFTITNTSAVFSLNNVSFTDTLTAGLIVSTPNALTGTCGGAITADAGSGAITLSGATLAANSNCTFSVNVTGTTAGVKNNSATLSTTELGTGATSTASITVIAPPTIAKAFSPSSVVAGNSSTVTLTLSNSNTTGALTNASLADTLVNMTAAGGAVGGTCIGTTPNNLSAGSTNLNFSGITIPGNGSCTVAFSVTSNNVGTNPNTTSGVTTNQTSVAGMPSNTANLTVVAPADLTITKTHAGNFTQGDTGKTYSIAVTNGGGIATSGTVSVTDTLPSGLTATAISGAGWNCVLGTLTCTRSDVLAAASSFPAITLTVSVASSAPASVTNTASVSGGGETDTTNNTANDATTINPAATYIISGQVTNGGAALEGVSVALSGASVALTVTDTSGNYSFANLTGGGNYTVTPSLNGYTFNPLNTPVNNLRANRTAVDFTTLTAVYEADAAPRPSGDGDGTVNGGDLTVIRRFVAGIETPASPAPGSEFQRVDCAPLYDAGNILVKGDGAINGGDITQVRRYAAGLDAVVPAGGPAAAAPSPSKNSLTSIENSLLARSAIAATRVVRPVKVNLVGNVLTVAVNLNTDAADTAANTVDFTLLYDTSVLSNPTNIRAGGNAPAATTVTPNILQSGKVGIVLDLPVVGATTTFPLGDAQLVLIDFTVAANPPASTTLNFGVAPVALFVGDINGNRLTTTFSSGSIALLAPTAATVTVSGRVMTESGRGINNVTVTMTDSQGGVRTARTNIFGYYRFYDVAAGETYILTAKGKRYEFSQSSQVLNVFEDNFDVNFIGHSGRF